MGRMGCTRRQANQIKPIRHTGCIDMLLFTHLALTAERARQLELPVRGHLLEIVLHGQQRANTCAVGGKGMTIAAHHAAARARADRVAPGNRRAEAVAL